MKTKVLNVKALNSIVSLLDDDDDTFNMLRRQIIDLGPDAFEAISDAVQTPSELVRERLQSLQEEFQRNRLIGDITSIPRIPGSDLDLEAGLFFIGHLDNADLQEEHYRSILDQMADRIRQSISPESSSKEIIEAINREMFAESGFHGNVEDYYHPHNSFLHCVLDSCTGLPITLSAVFMLLGKRLNFPVRGIGLPQHFIVLAGTPGEEVYIDPYNGGETLSEDRIKQRFETMAIPEADRQYGPVSNVEMLLRCCRNLQNAFVEHKDNSFDNLLQQWESHFESLIRKS